MYTAKTLFSALTVLDAYSSSELFLQQLGRLSIRVRMIPSYASYHAKSLHTYVISHVGL